jgi:hypothetical protein
MPGFYLQVGYLASIPFEEIQFIHQPKALKSESHKTSTKRHC